jgi:hypothetical protein
MVNGEELSLLGKLPLQPEVGNQVGVSIELPKRLMGEWNPVPSLPGLDPFR